MNTESHEQLRNFDVPPIMKRRGFVLERATSNAEAGLLDEAPQQARQDNVVDLNQKRQQKMLQPQEPSSEIDTIRQQIEELAA